MLQLRLRSLLGVARVDERKRLLLSAALRGSRQCSAAQDDDHNLGDAASHPPVSMAKPAAASKNIAFVAYACAPQDSPSTRETGSLAFMPSRR